MDPLFSDGFEDLVGRAGEEGGMAPTLYLPVDILDTDNGYIIEAPAPGLIQVRSVRT